jgi:hypothetical protein
MCRVFIPGIFSSCTVIVLLGALITLLVLLVSDTPCPDVHPESPRNDTRSTDPPYGIGILFDFSNDPVFYSFNGMPAILNTGDTLASLRMTYLDQDVFLYDLHDQDPQLISQTELIAEAITIRETCLACGLMCPTSITAWDCPIPNTILQIWLRETLFWLEEDFQLENEELRLTLAIVIVNVKVKAARSMCIAAPYPLKNEECWPWAPGLFQCDECIRGSFLDLGQDPLSVAHNSTQWQECFVNHSLETAPCGRFPFLHSVGMFSSLPQNATISTVYSAWYHVLLNDTANFPV